ncbi:MAG: methionine adenosyltransferase [Chloroflexi bacterium]|nr:methionine adenosyltransferase [Chloroflexota bacterium]
MSRQNGADVFWTAESVTEGHPDKVADAISDAIVDEFLSRHPYTRVAAETFLPSAFMAVVGGEIGIPEGAHFKVEDVNYTALVREQARRIGYTDAEVGFDGEHCIVSCNLKGQSVNIAQGVTGKEQGAGDQGMMFGYACRETEELMPAPITYAQKLVRELAAVRRSGAVPDLRPDGKSQVTFRYKQGCPTQMTKVVIATQHAPVWNDKQGKLKDALRDAVAAKVLPGQYLNGFDWNTQFIVNGTGVFEIGGPRGDSGLTGRKIIVDSYGGMAPHGGGAFSGKDPTKVDRSANYYARYVAKNIVAAGLAERCQVRVAYAIGQAQPIGLDVETFDTQAVARDTLLDAVKQVFDFRPASMVAELNLRRPIYKPFSAYGHFGRTEAEGATWESVAKAQDLRRAAGL